MKREKQENLKTTNNFSSTKFSFVFKEAQKEHE